MSGREASRARAASKTPRGSHKDLVARVGFAVRQMGAQSILTSHIVAQRFGLHTTDLEVLDLIYLREQASAGELAAATGLTSGSVTALIDRLVAAGYIERIDDATDRRRRLVRLRRDATAPIEAVYRPIQKRMYELWSGFSTRDLETILEFLERSTELQVACAAEIAAGGSPASLTRRRPRAGLRERHVQKLLAIDARTSGRN